MHSLVRGTVLSKTLPALSALSQLGSRHSVCNWNTTKHVYSQPYFRTGSYSGFKTVSPIMMGRRAAKIAGRKGKQDAARSKLYGKIGKQIVAAAKAGGGVSPESNSQLAEVLRKAQNANVPKDLIERNLKRGADSSQANYSENTYEAYGFGGVGVVIECLTDNNNRTNSEVKDAIKKSGGKVAESGSVAFQFERKGWVYVNGGDEDQVFEVAIDAGAEDVLPLPKGGFKVVTEPTAFGLVRNALQEAGLELDAEKSGLSLAPMNLIETSDEDYEGNIAMFERLLDLDDVDEVFSNQADDEGEDDDE